MTLKLSDKSFIDFLRSNPAFSHINIDKELFKIDEWLKRHPGRHKTRRFVLHWLDRIEIPLQSGVSKLTEKRAPILTRCFICSVQVENEEYPYHLRNCQEEFDKKRNS